jgi:hypothetical protein
MLQMWLKLGLLSMRPIPSNPFLPLCVHVHVRVHPNCLRLLEAPPLASRRATKVTLSCNRILASCTKKL